MVDMTKDHGQTQTPWLTLIGMGDSGLSSLSAQQRDALMAAEILVTGERLEEKLESTPPLEFVNLKRILNWKSGFRDVLSQILALEGQPVVVLATGDPMHFGIGATLLKHVPASAMRILPAPSAFSLAAARLGWPLQHVVTLSLHGRDLFYINRHILPGQRIITLTSDGQTPHDVAALLSARGFGETDMVVLEHMGGPRERLCAFNAASLLQQKPQFADFNCLALHIKGQGAYFPPLAGLPDHAFRHDGQLTKREVRTVTLSLLQPFTNALLWDVGAGCGSIAIEFMRSGLGTRACAIEQKPERLAMISENAHNLGVPDLEIIAGQAPECLNMLDDPDMIFIGGGVNAPGLFEACYARLKPGGRLVANAVTLEGEARLAALYSVYGGEMLRMQVQRAAPVGRFCGWKSHMPVTLWSMIK